MDGGERRNVTPRGRVRGAAAAPTSHAAARGERCTGAKATCSATLRHVEGRRASPLDGDAVHEAQLRLAVALSPLRARLVSRGEADHTEEGAVREAPQERRRAECCAAESSGQGA